MILHPVFRLVSMRIDTSHLNYRYKDRQLFLLSRLPIGSTAIVASSSLKYQSWSIPYEYRQNSAFHYLCGIDQPNLVLVLQKLQRNEVRRCLFLQDKPE